MLNWASAAAAMEQAIASFGADAPGGAAVLFDLEGRRSETAAGLESLASRRAMTPDSILRCASVTKHVFASFVLAHPEAISLDDPLGLHLPQLSPATAAVTVGQALDMSGGIPDTRECLTLIGHSIFSQTHAAPLLAFHADMDRLNYPAGTEVHYSNGGYRLVEEAMRAKGLIFDDFLKSELREGLGLPLRAAEMWTDPVPGLVPGYWHDGQGWKLGLQGMHLSAAGSLTTSARGLAGWGEALLRGEGTFKGRLSALSAPRHLSSGQKTGYGLGMRQHQIGDFTLVGHGGSQPGYKSYLLLDPAHGLGFALIANRDDVNTAGIASSVMATLLGQSLPEPGSDLTPGLYVTETGADWIEVRGQSVVRLDDEVAVYPMPDGGVDSLSPTSRLELHMEGKAVVGYVGHDARRYLPATPEPLPQSLTGRWISDAFGANLEIQDGAVVMQAGPSRKVMPLSSLGQGRFLFTLTDGPWRRRICLNHLDENRIELALSRARMIDYRKLN